MHCCRRRDASSCVFAVCSQGAPVNRGARYRWMRPQPGSVPGHGQREGRMLPTLPTEGPRPPAISMAWLSMRKAVMSFQS